MITNELMQKMDNALNECFSILKELELNDNLNEQATLNWLDNLNKLSVKY